MHRTHRTMRKAHRARLDIYYIIYIIILYAFAIAHRPILRSVAQMPKAVSRMQIYITNILYYIYHYIIRIRHRAPADLEVGRADAEDLLQDVLGRLGLALRRLPRM